MEARGEADQQLVYLALLDIFRVYLLKLLTYQVCLVRDEVDIVQLDRGIFWVQYKSALEIFISVRDLFKKRRIDAKIRIYL